MVGKALAKRADRKRAKRESKIGLETLHNEKIQQMEKRLSQHNSVESTYL